MKYATRGENLIGLSQDDLISAAQEGDLKAFNRLVLLHQDEVFGLALGILGDEDAAEAITQDTFLTAYRNLPRFRNGSFRLWLCRSVINAGYDALRRRKIHPFQPLEAKSGAGEPSLPGDELPKSSALPQEAHERRGLERQFRQALNQLDIDQRVVVVLVDLQDFDYQEAAQILGISVGTVKSRLTRARLQLHHRLGTISGIR